MNKHKNDVNIYVAFRFHVNFYHSYRGDTNDELGFGKDIRIIRNTIRVLDEFNNAGIPVKGTWDIENYFSLEKIMPQYCPDIIESWQRRVKEGKDQMELMSYNNGLMSASNAAEFEAALVRAISNGEDSGIKDLFGPFAPVVRPQEMMYTPTHISLYKKYGVEALSLYYSAIPFNCYSCFVPLLPIEKRFNPMRLTYPQSDDTLVLIPAHNHGDLVDNISMRKWLKRLRKEQLNLDEPKDLLMLIDADADDEFWVTMDVPVANKILSILQGLPGLVNSIKDLDFVRYTTPYEYLQEHPPVHDIYIGQDTADGSFDGLSSWAEKWSNHQLWTGVERSRLLEIQSGRLLEETGGEESEVKSLLSLSFEKRLKSLSTTHFGMAAPVMNKARLKQASALIYDSVKDAGNAFAIAENNFLKINGDANTLSVIDFGRGKSSEKVQYKPEKSRAIVRVPVHRIPEGKTLKLIDDSGKEKVCSVISSSNDNTKELVFREEMDGGNRKDYRIELIDILQNQKSAGITISPNELSNDSISLMFNEKNQSFHIYHNDFPSSEKSFLQSSITYKGKKYSVKEWTVISHEFYSGADIGILTMKGQIEFKSDGRKTVEVERRFLITGELPYLYVTVTVSYPQTPMQKYVKGQAERLQQKWDGNWHEVMPCEFRPAIKGSEQNPLKLWKHNYFGDTSYFEPDYSSFSKNRELDSCNNQITNGWMSVTNGESGILLGQSADYLSSMAFCPVRTRKAGEETEIYLNPFGSYSGKQYLYPSAYTGLGRLAAVQASASDHLKPYAPSYNGKSMTFSLMVAPYGGDKPPADITADAMAFSYPYMVVSGSEFIGKQVHRKWKNPVAD